MESSRNKRVVSAALIVCAVLGVLHTRPASAEYTVRDWERDEEYAAKKKSPWGAFGLALGVPVVFGGLAVAASGTKVSWLGSTLAIGTIIIGPAAGHIYVGEHTHAVLTSLGRLVLATTGAGMIGYAMDGWGSSDHHSDAKLFFDLGLIFFAASVVLAIYDIVDAPFAAHRCNEKLRKEIDLALTPLIVPQGYQRAGQPLYGLSLRGAF